MPIYRTTGGRYVGTQAEAGKGFETIELPRDKQEILALLNKDAAAPVIPAAAPAAAVAAPVYQHMTAACVLRRMDSMLAANKGAGAIADYIGTAAPEELALFAAAVAMRLNGAGVEPLPKGAVLADDGEES
jgi:hypothetical protein